MRLASADFELRFNPNPDVQTLAFIRKQDIALQSTGANMLEATYDPPVILLAGPGIIKVQGFSSANDRWGIGV